MDRDDVPRRRDQSDRCQGAGIIPSHDVVKSVQARISLRLRGVFDDVLITIDLVSQACARAITATDVAGAPKILGVDVARFGDDRSVIQRRQGLAAFPPIILQGVNNMDLAARVANEINTWKPDAVFIDGGGVGGGVIDRLRQLGFDIIEVNFGGKPISDKFANKRAEMWNGMAEWLTAGGCLPNNPELKTDLCVPTYSLQFRRQDDSRIEG